MAHIINRYDFNTVCAGVLRLIEKPELYQRYKDHIDSDFFFYNDISVKSKGLRKLLEVLAEMDEQKIAHDMTMNSVEAHMARTLPDNETSGITRELFYSMRRDEAILSRVNEPACFRIFLDYLKVLRLAKHAGPMFSEYQAGKIDEAAKHMTTALAEINQIQDPEVQAFDFEENYDDLMQGKNTGYIRDILPIGCQDIDSALGGGFETQTLTNFISTSGGGKSTMCHHLIKQCFRHRKYVHVTCVEDRPRSFLAKLTATLTGIPVSRLKGHFNELSIAELAQVETAKKLMIQYLKVDFVYGQSVETIQKAKLDYDLACKAEGKPAPVVDIIDYTGHIASRTAGDKMYEKMRTAYGARKDFALANNKIVFDFAQINREGKKLVNDNGVLGVADLAGSFDIAQVCDNIISLNRSTNDEKAGTARLHICKSRDGESGGTFAVKTDFSTATWHMDQCNWTNAPMEMVRNTQHILKNEKDDYGAE